MQRGKSFLLREIEFFKYYYPSNKVQNTTVDAQSMRARSLLKITSFAVRPLSGDFSEGAQGAVT